MSSLRVLCGAGCLLLLSGLAATPSWGLADSGRVGSGSDREGGLASVSAVSANDVWVVGGRRRGPYTGWHAGAEHWDGQAWRWVPVPHPGTESLLHTVDAVSATDVWAGGDWGADFNVHTLLVHWDGTAWTKVPFPGGAEREIWSISAVAPDDVWVSGIDVTTYQDFVGHWDAFTWTIQQPPGIGMGLHGLDVRAADDVLVAGAYHKAGAGYQPMVEQWDGTTWTVEPVPPGPDRHQNYLNAIDSSPSGHAWAVGAYGGDGGGGFDFEPNIHDTRTLAYEWDGTNWTRHKTANPAPDSELAGVVATADDDVWAVGGQVPDPWHPVSGPLIEHWDGTAWSVVDSPPFQNGGLSGVDATSSTDAWAVGGYNGSVTGAGLTLVLHWDGTAWTKV